MNRQEDAQHKPRQLKVILEKQKEEKEEELASLDTGNKEVAHIGRIHNTFDHIYKAIGFYQRKSMA
ncbi:MAG: hypothetical protein PUF39_04730 [Prevotellaceae bacterium]|nr:hypothetical protein [Prevotellaceae bacterium]